ncbi:MAG: twin-arginine translocase TatA/TatE family subunit [Undibacterium sp.]|nr:twin-arginine translocase TatA/TatE family subunit [Opitutaceae bacterium]
MNLSIHPLAFIEGVGGPEMMLILIIVLVLFGGKKLPELARGLGKSVKEFKKAASGVEEEFKRAMTEEETKKPSAILPPAPIADPVLAAPVQPITPVTEKPHGHADV